MLRLILIFEDLLKGTNFSFLRVSIFMTINVFLKRICF